VYQSPPINGWCTNCDNTSPWSCTWWRVLMGYMRWSLDAHLMDADELLTNVTVMQEMMTDVVAFRQLQQHTTTQRPKDLFFLFFLLFFQYYQLFWYWWIKDYQTTPNIHARALYTNRIPIQALCDCLHNWALQIFLFIYLLTFIPITRASQPCVLWSFHSFVSDACCVQ